MFILNITRKKPPDIRHMAVSFLFIYLVLYICTMTHNWTLEYKIKINRSGLY